MSKENQALSPNDSNLQDLQAEVSRLTYENNKRTHIMEVGLELARQVELADLFPLVIAKVTEVMEADRSSLFLYDYGNEELWTMVAQGLDIDEIRIPVAKGLCGYVCRSGETLNIKDAYGNNLFDRSWDQATGYRTRSVLCMPLLNRQGKILGALQVLNKKTSESFSLQDENFLRLLTSQIAVYVENAELYQQIEILFESVVAAIALAIDERDPVTAGHSRRVTEYSMQIAKAIHQSDNQAFGEVRFSRNQFKELRYACLLHDFGKVGIPESILQKSERLPQNWINVIAQRLHRQCLQKIIDNCQDSETCLYICKERIEQVSNKVEFLTKLNKSGFLDHESALLLKSIFAEGLLEEKEYDCFAIKKGTLTPDEKEQMESHVAKTITVLEAIPWPEHLQNVPDIASGHHETLDGKGYPRGLKAEEIPLGGKIMAVADIYDALTSHDRPYKHAIPHEKSIAIISNLAKQKKIDTDIVDIFVQQKLFKLPKTGKDTKKITLS